MKVWWVVAALGVSACATTVAPTEARLVLPALAQAQELTFHNDGPEAALLTPPVGVSLSGVLRVAAGQTVRVHRDAQGTYVSETAP